MSQVLAKLDAEWCRLARDPRSRRALRCWATAHPALGGTGDLGELLDRRRNPSAARSVLGALAALAPTDDLAARALLQAVLPGLVRLAGTAGYDDPAAIDDMVSLAWERIRTYPPGRPGAVAGNVLLDVRKRYRRHRLLDAPRSPELSGEPPGGRAAEDEALDRLALEEWLARGRALVGERCYRAVVRTRVHGLSLAEHAAEENAAVNTVGQRRWRALRQLEDLPLAG
jgi:DNA-directed RNA polymerase specialized sigma24 family protein